MTQVRATLFAALATLSLAAAVGASPQVEELGFPQGVRSRATAVSADGSTAIVWSGGYSRWTEAGGLEPYSVPSGAVVRVTSLSHDGSKASGTVDDVPTIWDSSLTPFYIDVSGTGFSEARDVAISGDGSTVVGTLMASNTDWHAFRWTASTGVVDIHAAYYDRSFGLSLSFDGTTVMGFGRRTGNLRPTSFIWTQSTGAQEVMVPTQSGTFLTQLRADGQLAAGYAVTGTSRDLIRWSPATGPVIVASDTGGSGYPFHVSADCTTIAGSKLGSAFVWTEAAGYTPLTGPNSVTFRDVNGDGSLLVGSRLVSPGAITDRVPFIWPVMNGTVDPLDREDLALAGAGTTEPDLISDDGSVIFGYVRRPIALNGLERALLWRADATIGQTYCGPARPNSASPAGARISLSGSNTLEVGELVLRATDMPPQTFGFFVASPMQQITPQPGGSQGVLCLGGGIGRFVEPGQLQNSGPTGSFSLTVDPNAIPTPTARVQPAFGETWNFQAWFRDSNPGSTSNFTDAATIAFF